MHVFTWKAIYNDGTHLNQIDPDGTKHAYADIDRAKLSAFQLIDESGRVVVDIHVNPGQRLIWRRRTEMSAGNEPVVCHIVGKQETVNGKNYQGVMALFENDGHTEVLGRFEENHPWLYPPQLLPEELGKEGRG
jgi:hypothetical protein